MGNAGRYAAPFPEPLVYLAGIGGCLRLLEKQVKFVHQVARVLFGGAVLSDPVPNLVLDNEHTEFFELLAELLYIKTYETVVYVDIRPVVKDIQAPVYVDLDRGSHPLRLFFRLAQKLVEQVLEHRHFFGVGNAAVHSGVGEQFPVDVAHGAVDHGLFYGLQPAFPTDDEFAERQYEVGFERQRVFVLRVIYVYIHRVDVIHAVLRYAYDLAPQGFYKLRVLTFRVADDNVVTGDQVTVRDLPFGGERFAAPGRA